MARTAVDIRVEPEVAWWRPLVAALVSLPHVLWTGVLSLVAVPVVIAIGVTVLVTGRVPARLAAFQVLVLRERVRAYALFFALRTDRPPLATRIAALDPGDDPGTTVSVDIPATLPRWSLVTRPFVALPHVLALLPIGVVMDLCYPVWMVIAAVNRGWPPPFARLLIAIERWVGAVLLYVLLATDEAPRFGRAAYGHDLPEGAVATP